MRLLPRALTALALLSGAAACRAHAATPQLYLYEGASCAVASQNAAARNMLGREEDGDLVFITYGTADQAVASAAYGLGCYKGQTPNVMVEVPLAFSAVSAGGYGLTRDAYTLPDVAAGKLDALFVAIAKDEVADGFPHAINRLGEEMSGGWYPWAAASNPALFQAAYCHVQAVMQAEAPGLTFVWNPAVDTSTEGQKPSCATAGGPDIYFSAYSTAGDTTKAEPGRWNAVLGDWYGASQLATGYAGMTKYVPEFGAGALGDDEAGTASALAYFGAQGVAAVGLWDSNASYAGRISDGSKPGEALEVMKEWSSLAPILAGASLYTGMAYKVSAPTGYQAFLAQLANGDVEQLAWGDAVGQTLQATDLTAQAAGAAKAGAVPALTVTNSQGATATVVPNADGSAVIEVTFPTTAATVTYDLKLSSPRKLAFATAAGGLLGGLWQGGKLFSDFTWGTAGGTARVYVAPR